MENVEVVVEDWPSPEIHRKLSPSGLLLGYYQGVPLPKRSGNYGLVLPDKIVIFQKPIESLASSNAQVREVVSKVVRHEIAHFFGFSDEELRNMEE
jgi:predicted Zn-dependent protease with MMP-like domain